MALAFSGSFFAAPLLAAIAVSPVAEARSSRPMSAEERERDAATIRRLNTEQLEYVRRRDAGYAQQWADYADAKGGPARNEARADRYEAEARAASSTRRDYDADLATYARERRRYEQDMQAWRDTVEACRAGDYEGC